MVNPTPKSPLKTVFWWGSRVVHSSQSRRSAVGAIAGKYRSGLTRLSVWWLRLGIGIERIKPGHPEQHGRHERKHLTLKREETQPAAPNFLQQQARFDALVARYNDERPHEALDHVSRMNCYLCVRNGPAE